MPILQQEAGNTHSLALNSEVFRNLTAGIDDSFFVVDQQLEDGIIKSSKIRCDSSESSGRAIIAPEKVAGLATLKHICLAGCVAGVAVGCPKVLRNPMGVQFDQQEICCVSCLIKV